MRASQRVATPWASKDYCDYSKHYLHTICRSAICFSRTAASNSKTILVSQGQWHSLESSSAVSRPVSGEAARSGLGARQSIAELHVCWRGRARQHARQQSRQQATGHLEPPQPACASTAAPVFSLSQPSFLTLPHPSHESFYSSSSSSSSAPSHTHVPIVTAQHAR